MVPNILGSFLENNTTQASKQAETMGRMRKPSHPNLVSQVVSADRCSSKKAELACGPRGAPAAAPPRGGVWSFGHLVVWSFGHSVVKRVLFRCGRAGPAAAPRWPRHAAVFGCRVAVW